MQGASLHRSYRFRRVKNELRPESAVQPAKAASRPISPVLRSLSEEGSHALIRFAHPSGSLRLSIFAALRFQDAVAFA
jgi:2-methylaconitate cis-trans-isomerase PrpF